MRREVAIIIAGVISLIPGGVGAALGDGRAQYGMALILIALPFYFVLLPLLFLPIYALIEHMKNEVRAADFLLWPQTQVFTPTPYSLISSLDWWKRDATTRPKGLCRALTLGAVVAVR